MVVPRIENWLEPVTRELGEITIEFPSHTIFRVPHSLVDENSESSYRPSIVSIGPFHDGLSPHLLYMEEHKKRYLLALMLRTANARQVIDSCGNALLELDGRVRNCYAEEITLDNTELARMLLRDGCFLIELFLRNSSRDYAVTGDHFLDAAWMTNALRRDLALLENQIPFFVLEKLFDLTVGPRYENQLVALKTFILQFFQWELNLKDERAFNEKCNDPQAPDHLLDLIGMCYISNFSERCFSRQDDWKFVLSAKELDEAGIKFKAKTPRNPLDLKLHRGNFEIPQLVIHGWTESLFRNLMAFEQCRLDRPSYITSYIYLMGRLMRTAEDAILLEKKQILKGYMVDAEAVASLFNNVFKQVVLMDFHFSELCNQVDEYHKRSWPRYEASLWRDYFPNPWKTIAFVVGVLILICTAVQAVYSALSYY